MTPVLRSLSLSLVTLFVVACSSVGPKATIPANPTERGELVRATLLTRAKHLHDIIRRGARPKTVTAYNEAVEQLLEDQYTRPGRLQDLPARWGMWRTDETETIDPTIFESLFPASLIRSDLVIAEPEELPGIGVPCVGWLETDEPSDPASGLMPPSGLAMALTAVLEFENGEPVWRLYDRYDRETVDVAGTEFELAADFSAALAVFDDRCELSRFGLLELLLPDKYFEKTGIFAVGDYDPDKIPVVFIHGVNSNPFTFVQMVDRLNRVDEVRDNFQFYFFYYPTGGGWIFNAPDFRASVRSLRPTFDPNGTNPGFDNMVVLAHSMGGLISRASVSTNPEEIYNAWFTKPVDQMIGSERNRRQIRDTFAYQPLEGVGRIVFMATPHRGSSLADLSVLGWISKLIKLPGKVTVGVLEAVKNNGLNIIEGNVENFRVPTSIDELSPNNRTVKAVSRLKFPADMHVHSIIGANKGDPKSDGIVPYTSSHIEEAESELIIESFHNVPTKKPAADEVLRILRAHLAEAGR